MARIKGWEKISDFKWKNWLTHKTVSISRYSPTKYFAHANNLYGSEVWSTKGLTMSEAKKEAVNYMRSHPNG